MKTVPQRKETGEGLRTREAANAHVQVFEQLFPLGTGF